MIDDGPHNTFSSWETRGDMSVGRSGSNQQFHAHLLRQNTRV